MGFFNKFKSASKVAEDSKISLIKFALGLLFVLLVIVVMCSFKYNMRVDVGNGRVTISGTYSSNSIEN